jgi:hypothetical protein
VIVFGVRVDPAVEEQLDAVSQQLGKSGSVRIREAIALAHKVVTPVNGGVGWLSKASVHPCLGTERLQHEAACLRIL